MSRCVHDRTDEEPCLPCAMIGPNPDPPDEVARDGARRGPLPYLAELTPTVLDARYNEGWSDGRAEAWQEARLAERARCRAIVSRLFANDWKGNEALEAIDRGGPLYMLEPEEPVG